MIEVKLIKQLKDREGEFLLDVDFTVPEGSFCAVYGPSGAGKSSLLKTMAGLLRPDDGHIRFGELCWYDHSTQHHLPPGKRRIAMVFQENTLFPHLSVEENLNFALTGTKRGRSAERMLEELDLMELKDRKPVNLSGGQRQRASLARALVQEPKALFLDEPLNALDNRSRQEMQELLRKVHRQYKTTIFLVTHDLREVFRLADHVLLLEDGQLISSGPPERTLLPSSGWNGIIEGLVVSKSDAECRVNLLIQEQIISLPAEPTVLRGIQAGDILRVKLSDAEGGIQILH